MFLFYLHYGILLLFGILLSAAFAGVQLSARKNQTILLCTFVLLGLLQVVSYLLFDESLVWKLYPLIAHLPLFLLLRIYYRKSTVTGLTAISTAYLCCQPANWFGLLIDSVTQNTVLVKTTQILTLLVVGIFSMVYLTPHLSDIFRKNRRTTWLIGSIPLIYYLFDYGTGIYSSLWTVHHQTVSQFIPFLLCSVFLLFCIIYHKEFEQKQTAEYKEQLIRITTEQQSKEIAAIKKSEQEIRLLRHDMRFLLNRLAVCLENGEVEKAQEMIASYSSHVDGTQISRFCQNDTVNYVLSDFVAKCSENEIKFSCVVEIGLLKVDEILFATVLSNALDNALNAQKCMPAEKRSIKLMIKEDNNRLLLSVKNPTNKKPLFVDGLPTTSEKGHGYGTQSIRYMTERMGGNCQFLLQDDLFILRIIL